MKNIISLIAIVFIANACKPNLKTPDVSKGDLDVTNYVALGGAITAGYADGALQYGTQNTSFAKLLSEQFSLIDGGEFKTPYISASSIGIGSANNAPSILGYRTDCQGTTSLGPVKVASSGDVTQFASNVYSSQGPFNNMGVPDIKVTDMDVNGYTNPFYVRMASSGSSSILSDAVAKAPTFFTLQLGLNDVLTYALSGATSGSVTPISGAVGVGFDASINNIVNKLTANGAKGAIASIPSIKSMAYFNTIAYNALKLDAATAANLNVYYGAISAPFSFKEGENGFVITDATQFLGFRQALEGELILLNVPLDSIKCHKWGSLIPIPERYVLSLSEITTIENAIADYNVILKNIAASKNLAFVDMNAFFANVKSGIVYNGVTINASFVSGGAYSLDGLNLTPRGNALLANEFIKAINSTYKSTLPQLVATKYPGVVFP